MTTLLTGLPTTRTDLPHAYQVSASYSILHYDGHIG